MAQIQIAALYKFASLPDFASLRAPLLACCEQNGVKGTLLLAEEGINGTIAGLEQGVAAVLAFLRADPRLRSLEHKISWAPDMPFYRLKVKLKREIVTMGVANLSARAMAGTYVDPGQWNTLVDNPDVVVVDVRNAYEVSIGSFEGAVNPHTTSFAEFPQWVREQSAKGGVLEDRPKVAMFCTGGIRCEKSTAYLRSQGFDEVYHLRGGILKYLETVPADESRWRGECFVFDERVSVTHGLAPGQYGLCRACRQPLGPAEMASPLYEEGISCPHCHGTHTEDRELRFRERQHQVELARARNQRHVGVRPGEPKDRSGQ